jgi:8-oxo-dGTP pyrophosphatase MutT (NUDIX family)
MQVVRDETGRIVGWYGSHGLEAESDTLLALYLEVGVPGLRGIQHGDEITEEEVVYAPDDPFFGLALNDQFERLGWTVTEMTENAFCPTGKGGGIDPHCGPNASDMHHALGPGWQHPPHWRKRSYGGVVVDDKGRYLLREPANHYEGYHWTFAKGKMDKEHEDPAQTAQREVLEETGFKTDIVDYVPGGHEGGQHHHDITGKPIEPDKTYYFLMKPKGSVGKMDWETQGYVWASYEDAKKLIGESTNERGRLRDLGVLEAAHALRHKVVHNQQFSFQSDPDKMRAFESWLRGRLEGVKGLRQKQLWEEYIAQGFHNGATRSYEDVVRTKPAPDVREALGAKNQFLFSTKNSQETVDRVKLLAQRTYTDLVGVTDRTAVRLQRRLSDGLMRGLSPKEIADGVSTDLGMELNNALRIARTEIVRANAEGQLMALSRLGVKSVGAMVEWTTSFNPCKKCEMMAGKEYELDKASGLIPLHPHCKCAWTPVVKLGGGGGLKAGTLKSKLSARRAK